MPVLLQTRCLPAGPQAVRAATDCLAQGGLVAFPTETVYGLGADGTNAQAVARLFAAKGRPAFNPLIAHVPDLPAAQRLGRFNEQAQRLAAEFWPGPLTLVVPKAQGCPVAELATSGLETIAIRVPDHPLAREILRAFGKPVMAPSANRSGHVSPTTAQHVLEDLNGRIDLIVDAGQTAIGLESTIVACLGAPQTLRLGGITRAALAKTLGHPLAAATETGAAADAPPAPGMLASHYAPRARLRLNAEKVNAGEALLAFGEVIPGPASHVMNLSPRGDLIEAAANLFGHLRSLDRHLARRPRAIIAVARIPFVGLGEAINDRLRRAAAPRPSA